MGLFPRHTAGLEFHAEFAGQAKIEIKLGIDQLLHRKTFPDKPTTGLAQTDPQLPGRLELSHRVHEGLGV
jgi:hypothetical protein